MPQQQTTIEFKLGLGKRRGDQAIGQGGEKVLQSEPSRTCLSPPRDQSSNSPMGKCSEFYLNRRGTETTGI